MTPAIYLTKNQAQTLSQTQFKNATDGQEAPQVTEVQLRYDDDYLYIAFDCQQNPYWHENTYKQHNTDLWNQEVFELFIAAGDQIPTRYLEVEINPNNALFVGWIDNPTQEAPENLQFVPYQEAKIVHNVRTAEARWTGSIQLPWALLGSKQSHYRLNFFRIVSLQSHTDPDWKCSPADCAFTCWSPSMSGATPRFHRPVAFGVLELG
ncbi:MAG: carbohydrate-binding family 9-like protein [Spirosomataceae bacterium]